jgi:ribA/ribD-fused uncharacterized protein
MRITDKYVFFWNGTFSQWKRANMVIDGVTYNCCEQYMMYKKAMLFGDQDIADLIMEESHPFDQKELGRQVKNFNKEKWDAVCKDYVFEANYAKFTQNKKLKAEMLETGDRMFVEASPKDTIWGIGMYDTDHGIEDPKNWKGTNWLGEVLTNVKKKIQDEDSRNAK